MRPIEYARPETVGEAVELLSEHDGATAVLAGGTDLIYLMQKDVLDPPPRRLVDLKNIPELQDIRQQDDRLVIGACCTLEQIADSPLTAPLRALHDVIDGIRSIQVQQMGTIGGDLCHLPNCWYFRNGYGLLALNEGRSLVESGENRYHAIFGNQGPAKFVSASRFAPALIACGASVRIVGPQPDQQETVPLEYFYVAPKTNRQGVTILKPGQFLSHVIVPLARPLQTATYEVLQIEGLDWPLAAAAAALHVEGGVVRDARIVMGHVAPVPWIADAAARFLVGRSIDEDSAQRAGEMAVAGATPLSQNAYKVQLARTAVKRAVLKAAGLLEGGV
ncbi:MAG: molybdopterin dehydrogenase [Planctomycetota bacterium]|nr:MAG: molybdopterin dehydrogenase [Planctomycetota bacterium]